MLPWQGLIGAQIKVCRQPPAESPHVPPPCFCFLSNTCFLSGGFFFLAKHLFQTWLFMRPNNLNMWAIESMHIFHHVIKIIAQLKTLLIPNRVEPGERSPWLTVASALCLAGGRRGGGHSCFCFACEKGMIFKRCLVRKGRDGRQNTHHPKRRKGFCLVLLSHVKVGSFSCRLLESCAGWS